MRAVGSTIEVRGRVSLQRRAALGLLALAGWLIYAAMVLPLLAGVLLRLLGFLAEQLRSVNANTDLLARVVDQVAGQIPTQVDPIQLAGLIGVSVAMALVLLTWAVFQRHRHFGLERRRRSPDVSVAEVALAMGAPDQVTEGLQGGKIVSLRMRPDGTPEHATVLLPLTSSWPAAGAVGHREPRHREPQRREPQRQEPQRRVPRPRVPVPGTSGRPTTPATASSGSEPPRNRPGRPPNG